MTSSARRRDVLSLLFCSSAWIFNGVVAFRTAGRSSFVGPGMAAAVRSPRPSPASSDLSMHFGHSHEEKETEGGGVLSSPSLSAAAPPPPKGILGRAGFLASRRPARVVFAALAILLPALIRNRCLSRADLTAFLVTSLALSVFDGVRREVNHGLGRIRRLKEGWDRHSPPLEELSPRKMLSEENAADRVTLLGVLVNLLLSVGKAGVGVTCHSSALMADAGHSLSDLFSDFITLWAVKIGRLPPDEDHPYGHGKFEAVGSLFLSLTLLVTGVGVGAASNRKLLEILGLSFRSEERRIP